MIQPITFPVLAIALLYDENGYKDKEYEQLCAEEWEKGSSHFLYHSDSADSLASCCRVSNKIKKNTFSSTTGQLGIMTGSCNVISLNFNRIVQNWFDLEDGLYFSETGVHLDRFNINLNGLKEYLITIVERVQKYHIAYKTILYNLEDAGMITYSKANWLYLNKLYSTIGSIGYYEAAKFLGLKDGSDEYCEFLDTIHSTIEECNKQNSIYDKKRPFIFNLEAVPGESLAIKFYNWDKESGYEVPSDQELYNSYFFNPWTESDITTKLKMHGKRVCKSTSGGQACHINLDEHLTADQYKMIMKIAREEGCNYFTFNIPITKCMECGHIVNGPVQNCPKCHSANVHYFTRVIGFLTDVTNWAKERRNDFYKRLFGTNRISKPE